MDTQLVYPFRLRRRSFERRRCRVKKFQGVAIRKHRGIGELKLLLACLFFLSLFIQFFSFCRWYQSEVRETWRMENCVNLFRKADTLLTLFHIKRLKLLLVCATVHFSYLSSNSNPFRKYLNSKNSTRCTKDTTELCHYLVGKFLFDYSLKSFSPFSVIDIKFYKFKDFLLFIDSIHSFTKSRKKQEKFQ